ncbi:MAG: hypothetical protein KGI06_06350, partial [Candidatus Micrarchaeota archaeon]|nr:hypothetical protein [Candidatus Micrarchaeota archaeon]
MGLKLPAFQFYPGDWRKDPAVQALSFEERGIWVELLCLMHESEQRGKLLLGGQPYPEDRLARALGIDILLMGKVISTLITLNVASRCPETGALICRRMVRMEEISSIRSKSGSKGGNPMFRKGETNPYYDGKDKQKHKQRDKQKITPSSSSSSSSSNSTPLPPAQPDFEHRVGKVGLAEVNQPVNLVNRSLDSKLNDSKLFERTMALRVGINSMFKRKDSDRWNHLEEEALCEVARRDDCLSEFQELSRFMPVRGRFFPQNVLSLLEKWTQTLDASRNGHVLMDSPETRLKAIRSVIETHPANKESIRYNPQHTTAEGDDYKQLRRDERE